MSKRITSVAIGLLATVPLCAGAAAPIYRCHAANDGSLLFQDRPCTQVPGTREAKTGKEGEVVPPAPPPAEDGGTASGRYTRLLDEADRERQTQAAADEAEAKRLSAERAAAATAAPAQNPSACRGYGTNGECLDAYYPGYGAYPYPPQRPPVAPVSPPSAPARPSGRRPPVTAAEAAGKATRDIMAIP